MFKGSILANILKYLPKLKNWMQATLYAVFLVVVAILFLSRGIQQTPLMLVIATIPLLIIMDRIKDPLPTIMQFFLLLFIAATCFGFLGVAALRTVTVDHDRANNTQTFSYDYYRKYNKMAESLDAQMIKPNEQIIINNREVIHAYSTYRDAILKEYSISDETKTRTEKKLDMLVTFFDTVAQSYYDENCSSEIVKTELARDMIKFWYLFRPIIEEMRARSYGKEYASPLQKFAEQLQPPEFRSDVTLDKATNLSRLTFPNG